MNIFELRRKMLMVVQLRQDKVHCSELSLLLKISKQMEKGKQGVSRKVKSRIK